MASTAATAGKRTAIIFGATGAVGKPLLSELLRSDDYAAVHSFTRSPFKAQSSHKDDPKLVEHLIDFEKLVGSSSSSSSSSNGKEGDGAAAASATLSSSVSPSLASPENDIKGVGADDVYITLGTTRAKAGSAANFTRIDREYVVAAAKAALGTTSTQKVIYCSASGANSKVPLLYPQSKGLTEEALASLGYSDCILFRPAFLSNAQREETRMLERVVGSFMTNVVGRVSSSADIKVSDLAKAMRIGGLRGSEGLTTLGAGSPPGTSFPRSKDGKVTVVSNGEARRLAMQV